MTKRDTDARHDRDPNVKNDCENARALVPSYLDGELSEAQAAPLREHLFACPGCRESAKEGRALKRWFQEADGIDAPVAPEGFAARVARRAFAGDPGLLVPVPPPAGQVRRELLPFLLTATAVAAALLLCFSIVIQRQSLPTPGALEASDYRPSWEEPAWPAAAIVPEPGVPDRGALDGPLAGPDAEPAAEPDVDEAGSADSTGRDVPGADR